MCCAPYMYLVSHTEPSYDITETLSMVDILGQSPNVCYNKFLLGCCGIMAAYVLNNLLGFFCFSLSATRVYRRRTCKTCLQCVYLCHWVIDWIQKQNRRSSVKCQDLWEEVRSWWHLSLTVPATANAYMYLLKQIYYLFLPNVNRQ